MSDSLLGLTGWQLGFTSQETGHTSLWGVIECGRFHWKGRSGSFVKAGPPGQLVSIICGWDFATSYECLINTNNKQYSSRQNWKKKKGKEKEEACEVSSYRTLFLYFICICLWNCIWSFSRLWEEETRRNRRWLARGIWRSRRMHPKVFNLILFVPSQFLFLMYKIWGLGFQDLVLIAGSQLESNKKAMNIQVHFLLFIYIGIAICLRI